ncbi:heat shock 70 kDa protein 12B-like [Ruditapes philippinarum]|uniref:heat shock 70 kDa protein 12B-like n=1 Tax=Ruditapes philippinarum TaxID=129788 RepID=UPI00295C2A1B|nr:heat shock 70 kDa protein 12B-like [Ruditapes philippinarum]
MNIYERVSSHLLVAAFDFGTTFSGYAFSFRDKPLEIVANNNWNDESNLSLKTPTCILLDPEEKFHSFGYEAENKYKMLCEEDEHHNWLFFRRFKMLLHRNKKLNRQTTVKDITGKRRMFAIDIFSLSIRYLRDHFFSELQKKYSGIEETDIQYVITIPAIWDDNGKQFMRMAALQADINNAKLTLALEPEAASICCKRITVDSKGQEFLTGLQYIVIDIGGGTADITAHQINDNGTLTELYKASGGPWGGINVDNNFLDFLKDLFGEQVMSSFKQKHLEDYWYMLREFETNKRQVKFAGCHEQEQTYITIKLPLALRDISKHQNGKVLEKLIGSSSFSSDIKVKRDKIRVGVELVRKWFDGPVNDIIRHIEDLLKTPEVRQVTTLILVGGMADSPYVQEKIRYAFSSKRLIIPKDAGLAVLKGAVVFGHEPLSISERVMRYSYGIEMFQRFKRSTHKSSFKVKVDGKSYVDNVFHVFVRAGDTVQVGQEITKIASPINKESSLYPIYRSLSSDPNYTTESDCEMIGLLTLKHVGQDDFESKKVKLTMIFGNTELMVKAEEINTVEKSSSTFNCLME